MLKRNILLVFLICTLMMPLAVSVANSFLSIDTDNYCLSMLQSSGEEDSEESKSKETHKQLISFSIDFISINNNLNPLNAEFSDSSLLNRFLDQPTPPPKF